MKQYDYIIVGSGLFGSVFAYKAHQAGKKCLVLEKRPHLGGNVYCECVEGINVHKYGAHIFHTSNRKVWDFVNLFVDFNRYTNSPVANYKGQLYNLPFNMNTFHQMWGVTTPEEAQEIINEQKYREAPSIDLIKAIWPVYKVNEYQNFTLPQGIHSKKAMAYLLNDAAKDFAPYTEICNRIDDLENKWKVAHRLSNLDSFASQADNLWKEIQDIDWWLKPKETYAERLRNLNEQFQEYSIAARRFNKEDLRRGDFVRMKNEVYNKNLEEQPDKLIYQENIFEVSNISDSGQIMTAESSIPLSFDDIEAVLIDGHEDSIVYYDPVIMASYVAPGQPVPVHHEDKSYYMEHFKRCYDVHMKAFTDCVAERGFQFVHEVQHWLKDEMQDEGLKLNHSFRNGI